VCAARTSLDRHGPSWEAAGPRRSRPSGAPAARWIPREDQPTRAARGQAEEQTLTRTRSGRETRRYSRRGAAGARPGSRARPRTDLCRDLSSPGRADLLAVPGRDASRTPGRRRHATAPAKERRGRSGGETGARRASGRRNGLARLKRWTGAGQQRRGPLARWRRRVCGPRAGQEDQHLF
jgi:hypothetical protein